jgi:hypothetical protein
VKRTPLRIKRPTPRRRAPDRVKHVREKPKPGAPPTAAEREHMDRVADLPCLVGGGCAGRVTLHHVSSDGYKRIARSHQRVVPLCERHHQIQHGPRESVEALGHAGFKITYGLDLLVEADCLWSDSQ